MDGDPHTADIAGKLGLRHGRMISASRSGYHRKHPRHFVIFNATIADDDGSRLWWGDLDLTSDEGKLAELARTLGRRLHLLLEGDAMFGDVAPIELAALVIDADGSVAPTHRYEMERDADGRIVRPEPVPVPDPGPEVPTDGNDH